MPCWRLPRVSHGKGNVALAVQNAPHVNVVILLNVEDPPRETCQWPKPQTCQIKFMGVTGRTRCAVLGQVAKGFFQRIQKAQRRRWRLFFKVKSNRIVNVLQCHAAWRDGFDFHLCRPAP